MNRRHFFAATLPAALGWSALRALAQDKPIPKLSPRRVKIEVSLLKPGLKLGETNARMMIVATEEDVETYASFLQMYTYQSKGDHSISQAFGPYLRVTPHIESDGKITLNAKVQYEEATASAAPNEPLPISSTSLVITRTVESGQSVSLGSVVVEGIPQQIQLTATLLKPHQTI